MVHLAPYCYPEVLPKVGMYRNVEIRILQVDGCYPIVCNNAFRIDLVVSILNFFFIKRFRGFRFITGLRPPDLLIRPINTLLLLTGALGYFTCLGMTLPIYMGATVLRGIRAPGDTLSNVESQVFTPYNFYSSLD